jgi:hypothetical protein
LPLGTDTIVATYNGDNNFAGGSFATLTQTVKDGTSIGLVSSQNPSAFNQSVTFTATVSGNHGGTPTGTVNFSVDGGTAIPKTRLLSAPRHWASAITPSLRHMSTTPISLAAGRCRSPNELTRTQRRRH